MASKQSIVGPIQQSNMEQALADLLRGLPRSLVRSLSCPAISCRSRVAHFACFNFRFQTKQAVGSSQRQLGPRTPLECIEAALAVVAAKDMNELKVVDTLMPGNEEMDKSGEEK